MADTVKLVEIDHFKEKLIELVGQVQDCGCDVTDVVEMNYVENNVLVDHLIANGVTVQKWIPVTERLPEKDGDYLTLCSYDTWSQILMLCFNKDGDDIWGGGFSGEKNVFYFDYDGVYVSQDNVTHWMPLPQPPKGE